MTVKRETPTLRQVTTQLLAGLTAPTSVEEVTRRVLERYPATAKDPTKRVRDLLHSFDMVGVELVFLDPKTIVPLRLAMPGVCFRVALGPDAVKSGMMMIRPVLDPFLRDRFRLNVAGGSIEVRDENDQIILTGLVKRSVKRETIWGGPATGEEAAFNVGAWLRAHRARAKDSVRVTIVNWRPARLRVEFESRSEYRREAFAAQDRALGDCIQSLLDESYDERIYTHPAILTAYARLPGARDYPGNPWFAVLANDPRFFVTDFDIRAGEGVSTVDFLTAPWDRPEVRAKRFTREQGRQVYRFTAVQNYGKEKRVIEMLGRHTLADFDDVLREAFDLDTFDHLSEFTRITPRGKGKRPREQQYGEINPFEPTPAMELRLAGLGWDVGTKLEYLYDFGDNLKHTLVLESIGDPERGGKYPRVVG